MSEVPLQDLECRGAARTGGSPPSAPPHPPLPPARPPTPTPRVLAMAPRRAGGERLPGCGGSSHAGLGGEKGACAAPAPSPCTPTPSPPVSGHSWLDAWLARTSPLSPPAPMPTSPASRDAAPPTPPPPAALDSPPAVATPRAAAPPCASAPPACPPACRPAAPGEGGEASFEKLTPTCAALMGGKERASGERVLEAPDPSLPTLKVDGRRGGGAGGGRGGGEQRRRRERSRWSVERSWSHARKSRPSESTCSRRLDHPLFLLTYPEHSRVFVPTEQVDAGASEATPRLSRSGVRGVRGGMQGVGCRGKGVGCGV